MAKVNISLDAELVVEVMVLAGVGSPQDAVEAVVRDYIARGHRTEARVVRRDDERRDADAAVVRPPQG
ncbi:type II toxin-antitoxin system VapB family antitoxin [Streptomyces sp. NBC_00536]|uniref:type II toxin-antitoxin system VapB family antitoxin n=1 Tax=Streptomyces sp. NBC_00536 TaxID=2975769 RepID=UPI002E8242EB|nr:type II toxin-antitoxin system VapB family antitoxin [Streptomyces sp. NBC_00536]WUC77880.1 type II toxin-antitoxin system VapB family antitoxin [Streptomyces sp. NBC_00536]